MASQTAPTVTPVAVGRPCGRCLARIRRMIIPTHTCCARAYCCGIPEHQLDLERVWSLRVPVEANEAIGSVVELRYKLDDDPPRWFAMSVRIDGFEFAPPLPSEAYEWFWARYA